MKRRFIALVAWVLIIVSIIAPTIGSMLTGTTLKPLPSPKFEITFDGPGVVLVKNVGDANATNVRVRRQLEGGFIILGKDKTVTIPSIAVWETKEAHLGMIFGFGKTMITLSVSCDEGATQSITKTALIFFFLIIGIH